MRTIAAFCLAIIGLSTVAASAKADGGCYWRTPGWYGGTVIGPQPYVPAPPYFALHPPVYYGKRYTRPYGASPFASRPMLNSTAGYAPSPAPTIRQYPVQFANPYHSNAAAPAPVLAQPGPKVIKNPFVDSSRQYAVH